MAEKIFIISAPVEQVRAIIAGVFTEDGWTAENNLATGGLTLTRGKKGLSIALGALAGKNFFLSQSVEFGVGPQGETIARYSSSTGMAISGGAIGVSKSNAAHADYVNKLGATLQARGILVGVQ